MTLPLAVYFAGTVIFGLGGLWYSPVLFAKKWSALTGKTEAPPGRFFSWRYPEARPTPLGLREPLSWEALLSGCVSAWVLAVVLNHFGNVTVARGAMVGALCWLGFEGAPSYAGALCHQKPRLLWLIDTGFNLASFVVAGIILAVCR